jgi:hypothetical protein
MIVTIVENGEIALNAVVVMDVVGSVVPSSAVLL